MLDVLFCKELFVTLKIGKGSFFRLVCYGLYNIVCLFYQGYKSFYGSSFVLLM